MDKQKQIKEMASDLSKAVIQDYGGVYFLETAEALYNAGYRKIPEGAMVLMDEDEIKQYEWSKMLDKMGFFKFADNLRKETAEKFAERLKDRAYYAVFDTRCVSVDTIDEICKEITGV